MEKKEIGQEIINEWYAEKGLTEKEVKPSQEKEEVISDPTMIPSAQKVKEDTHKEEECKKMAIKKEIKELIAIAEAKGLQKSIKEAKKRNDPFLLDVYHDVIAKDAAFKKFLSR